MTKLSQLETYSNDLAAATKTLTDHYRDASNGSTSHPTVTNDTPRDVRLARNNILAISAQLQTLLTEPAEFIQHLAGQVYSLLQTRSLVLV